MPAPPHHAALIFRTAWLALGRRGVGWVVLACSLIALLLSFVVNSNSMDMSDLEVYLEGARHLFGPELYSFTATAHDLPFTYPPFAALLFLPFLVVPVMAAKIAWILISLTCLTFAVRRFLSWVYPSAAWPPGTTLNGFAMGVTGIAIWFQPVRATIAYGQINLLLLLVLVVAATAARAPVAGLWTGLCAGVKLIPISTIVFFIARRSPVAAVGTVVAFLGTVAVGFALNPGQANRYFFHLLTEPDRAGKLWNTNNQSLRGAISRFTGHDNTGLWILGCGVAAAIGLWALIRMVHAADAPGALLVVQMTTLLVSPISWDHHWVWVVPCFIWCAARAAAERLVLAGVVAVGWLLLSCSFLVSIRIADETVYPGPARPLGAAILDDAYSIAGFLTLLALGIIGGRLAERPARGPASPATLPGRLAE